jgi:hypothetical protein
VAGYDGLRVATAGGPPSEAAQDLSAEALAKADGALAGIELFCNHLKYRRDF